MHPKPHAFKGATWMALATVLLLGACANPPAGPTQTDGTYCFNPGRSNSKSKTCTPVAVPSEQAQAQARQFAPVPGAAALYVVRNRLDDAHNRVPVSVDGRAPVITVPGSVLRVLLAPGQHRVSLDWDGKRVDLDVKACGGEWVRPTRIVGKLVFSALFRNLKKESLHEVHPMRRRQPAVRVWSRKSRR